DCPICPAACIVRDSARTLLNCDNGACVHRFLLTLWFFMSDTIVSLTQAQLAYGHHPLLDHADLAIQAGERIGLIGRNGAGKSSLLRVLDGRTQLDDGEIRRAGGLRVATVE